MLCHIPSPSAQEALSLVVLLCGNGLPVSVSFRRRANKLRWSFAHRWRQDSRGFRLSRRGQRREGHTFAASAQIEEPARGLFEVEPRAMPAYSRSRLAKRAWRHARPGGVHSLALVRDWKGRVLSDHQDCETPRGIARFPGFANRSGERPDVRNANNEPGPSIGRYS
jgi:hypothetical protein